MRRKLVRRIVGLERARRAVAHAALVVLALWLAFVPQQMIVKCVALREDLDERAWHDMAITLALMIAPLLAVAATLPVAAWRSRRDAGWTRLVLDDDGVHVTKDSRARRLPWVGLSLASLDRGLVLLQGSERIVLDGSWAEAHDDLSEGPPESFAFGGWRESATGRELLARAPERSRARWPRVQLFVGLGLSVAYAALVILRFQSVSRALEDADGFGPNGDAVARARAVVARRADSPLAWRALSRELLVAGRPEEALEAANAAFALPDRPHWVLDVRSDVLERLGRNREAARDRAGLVSWDLPWTNAAETSRLLLLAGDVSGARRQAERAVALRATPGTLQALARVEAEEQRLRDAADDGDD